MYVPNPKTLNKHVILFNSCGDYGRRYLSSFHLVPLWRMFTRCDSELWVHFFGISLNIFYLFVATGGLNFEPMLGKYLTLLIINIIIRFCNWGITFCSSYFQRIRIKESSISIISKHLKKTMKEQVVTKVNIHLLFFFHQKRGSYHGYLQFALITRVVMNPKNT
jgi:hypothetical protein